MNSNGIFTARKYLAPVNGLGCNGGCNGGCKGTGEILGQDPASLAVGVVAWTAGAIFLYFVFKNLNKPVSHKPYSMLV